MDLEQCLWWYLVSLLFMNSTGFHNNEFEENTELIQQRAGNDIKLQCGLKGLMNENDIEKTKVHWYFKQCSDANGSVNRCNVITEDDWTQLPCEESLCKADLLLHNITEKYSGLYKCTVYPALHTIDIKLVRTYQLEVKNASMVLPEFLDLYPYNQTVKSGDQVVFECRVQSEVHPTIKWFRRISDFGINKELLTGSENVNFNAHFVRHNGRTYELLPSTREKYLIGDVYLSKLILNKVDLVDEGYYACVAINYRGHNMREVYLRIKGDDSVEYWNDYDSNEERTTDPKEFWLLFLMPLGLAIPPIIVWLCYTVIKQYKNRIKVKKQRQQIFDNELAAQRCFLNS